MKLKEKYIHFNKKLLHFPKKSIKHEFIEHISNNFPLSEKQEKTENVLKKSESLKHKKKIIEAKNIKIATNTKDELIFQKEILQKKIKKLIQENEKLRLMNTNSNKTLKKDEFSQKIYSDYLDMKNNINKLKLIHKENSLIIKSFDEQLLKAELNPQKQEILEINFDYKAKPKYIKLNRKYKLFYKLHTNQINNLEKKRKALEEIEKKLDQSKIFLQMKLLRIEQQNRLLGLIFNQLSTSIEYQNYTDARFLYKPSIKNLYN